MHINAPSLRRERGEDVCGHSLIPHMRWHNNKQVGEGEEDQFVFITDHKRPGPTIPLLLPLPEKKAGGGRSEKEAFV